MKHFLTHGMLAGLYNEIDKSVVCYKKLRKMSEGGSVTILFFLLNNSSGYFHNAI